MHRTSMCACTRSLATLACLTAVVVTGLSGCMSLSAYPYKAEETRVQSIPYVQDTGLQVVTANGWIEVSAEPGRSDVELTANVRAAGSTQTEADDRLAAIVIQVESRIDAGTGRPLLDVTVAYPDTVRRANEGCSFSLKVPGAHGVILNSSNGSLSITGLTGDADLKTSNGKVHVTDHAGGAIRARSSNGAIDLVNVVADSATVDTSNGPIRVAALLRSLEAESSNGRITYEPVQGSNTPDSPAVFAADDKSLGAAGCFFSLRTSNGPVTVRIPRGLAPDRARASTSNGTIQVSGPSFVTVSGSKTEKAIRFNPEAGVSSAESLIRTSNGSITIEVVE